MFPLFFPLSILPLAVGRHRSKRALCTCCESHMFGSNIFLSTWLQLSQSGYHYQLYWPVCKHFVANHLARL